MHRIVPATLALLLLSTGCLPRTKAARNTALVAGAAMVVTGALIYSDVMEGDDTDGDGLDEFPDAEIACGLGGCFLPVALVVGGAGTFVLGLSTSTEDDEDDASADEPTATTVPPEITAPGFPLALQRPLPEIEVDAQTLRLAKQVRSAVLRTDCNGATITLDAIRDRDLRYHDALLASSVLDGCR